LDTGGPGLTSSATRIDIFVPASDDMIRMCVGPCGDAKPAKAFPTITGRPGVRLSECMACCEQRDASFPQTDYDPPTPHTKHYPAGGRRERAALERRTVADVVANVVTAHPNEAIKIAQIYEEVFDSVSFVPKETVVRDAVRELVKDDGRFVKVARDVYSWAPDGNVPPPPTPPHVVQMIERRRSGRTLDEIGREFGVTRERIRQLLTKHGGPDAREVRRMQAERTGAEELVRATAVSDTIRLVLVEFGPSTPEDIAERTGLEATEAARFWPRDLAHLKLRTGHYETRWSDEQILAVIREAALYEFPLTTNAYGELLAVGQIEGPSLPRIGQRFGSWTAACEAAGVVAGQTMRHHYQSQWSDGDILVVVRGYLEDPNAPNSIHGYDDWKRVNAPDGPSGQTIRNRFGSWTEVKRRALTTRGPEGG
jgi:hypothetical protein